jgi:hypothetical protein
MSTILEAIVDVRRDIQNTPCCTPARAPPELQLPYLPLTTSPHGRASPGQHGILTSPGQRVKSETADQHGCTQIQDRGGAEPPRHQGHGGGREAQMPPALGGPACRLGFHSLCPLPATGYNAPVPGGNGDVFSGLITSDAGSGGAATPPPLRCEDVGSRPYATWTKGIGVSACAPAAWRGRERASAMCDGPFPGSQTVRVDRHAMACERKGLVTQ